MNQTCIISNLTFKTIPTPTLKNMQKLANLFIPKAEPKETMKNPNEETSFTFKVDDVEPNRNLKGFKTSTPGTILFDRIGSENLDIDDFSHKRDTKTKLIVSDKNGLMAAAHFAYVSHYPLKISVSDFILMIGQGIAAHLEIHAEDVRPYFVNSLYVQNPRYGWLE